MRLHTTKNVDPSPPSRPRSPSYTPPSYQLDTSYLMHNKAGRAGRPREASTKATDAADDVIEAMLSSSPRSRFEPKQGHPANIRHPQPLNKWTSV